MAFGIYLRTDEVDVESFEVDRREEALKRRYGDKQVIYPPMPEDWGKRD